MITNIITNAAASTITMTACPRTDSGRARSGLYTAKESPVTTAFGCFADDDDDDDDYRCIPRAAYTVFCPYYIVRAYQYITIKRRKISTT